jgi:hypothetical protein
MFKKNTAVAGFTFHLRSATDGSDTTTGTPVGYVTLDGGTQTAIGDVTPVHEGNGEWSVDLTAAEMNGDIVSLVFVLAGSVTADFKIKTVASTTDDLAVSLGNLATGSAAISVVAESDVVTTGSETNTYAVTDEVDGVYHQITDVAGALELYYQFDVGGNGVAATCQFTGRLTSANDTVGVYAYNWGGASWDQVGTLNGTGGTSDGVEIFSLLTRHTGTGVNLGKVRIRGYAASGLTSATLYIDQAIISYAVVAQSVGYANGAIWFDSNASNTNTEVYVDGTADNPVSTEAAVNTLIASTGLNRVEVTIDSTITFTTAHTGEFWTGEHWTLALGGQDVSSSHFNGADVSGIGTGTSSIDFIRCHIETTTLHQFHMEGCGFSGTLTLGEAGNYIISNGHSSIAGSSTPIIDTGAALLNVNLSMPDYHNGIEIRNLNNAGADSFSISGIGQIIYAASSSGAVNQRGIWKVTNTGGVTITTDDNTTNLAAALADTNELQTNQGNWLTVTGHATEAKQDIIDTNVDSILVDTGTTLPALLPTALVGGKIDANVGAISGDTTAADNLEASLETLILGTATGTPTTTTMADSALTEATDDHYKGRIIIWRTGALAGQATDITAYNGTTKTFTFTATTNAATAGDAYVIV